jgi:hypothetical protein
LISTVENESPDLLGLTGNLTYALSMQELDTWYAYFHVRGSFAPDDVTRRVGVAPTKTAREGDVIGTTSKNRPCSLWALHSRLGTKEAKMKIVGCDLRARQQTIAMVETETGEFSEKTLNHV